MEKTGKILRILLFATIFSVAALSITLQLPMVQDNIKDKTLELLKDNFDADIHIGRVRFSTLNTIIINDVAIIDRAPLEGTICDTLASAGFISIKFSPLSHIGPEFKRLKLREVRLRDFHLNIISEPDTIYYCNLRRMFRNPRTYYADMTKKDLLSIDVISFDNMRYTMQNLSRKDRKDLPPNVVNWSELDARRAFIRIEDFKIRDAYFSGKLKHFELEEVSGAKITGMTASALVGRGGTRIRNLHLEDGSSSIDLDLQLIGKKKDFYDFSNQVDISANIKRGHITFPTLSHLIPRIPDEEKYAIDLSGAIIGRVRDLSFKKLRFALQNTSISTEIDGKIRGLNDTKKLFLDLGIRDTRFTTSDIDNLSARINPDKKLSISHFGDGELFRSNIRVKGYLNDMTAELDLHQGKTGGSFSAVATLKGLAAKRNKPLNATGRIESENLDLKTLLGKEKLGPASVKGLFSATLPRDGSDLLMELDSLAVNRIHINGYDYGHICGDIILQGKDLNVDIEARDKSLDADITVWSDKYCYNGSIALHRADLHAMNIDKRGTSVISSNLYCHLDKDLKVPQGNADITNIHLINEEGDHRIGDIILSAIREDGKYDIELESPMLHADFNGTKKEMTSSFKIGDMTQVLDFCLPGAYIEKGTDIAFNRDGNGLIHWKLQSGRIAYNNNFIKDIALNIEGPENNASAHAAAEQIQIGNMAIWNNVCDINMRDSLFCLKYNFRNPDGSPLGNADLNLDAVVGKNKDFAVSLKPSSVKLNGDIWKIPYSRIFVKDDYAKIDSLRLSSGEQDIFIDGIISRKGTGTLAGRINRFDISYANSFFKKINPEIKGRLDADFRVSSPFRGSISDIDFFIIADSLTIKDSPVNQFTAECHNLTDNGQSLIRIRDWSENHDLIKVNAVYTAESKYLDMLSILDRLPLDFIQSLVPGLLEELKGSISGNMRITGTRDGRTFSGEGLKINDVLVKPALTRVPYRLNGGLKLLNNSVSSNNLTIEDRFGNKGMMTGGIKWSKGHRPQAALQFRAKGLEVLNIPKSIDNKLSGHLFTNGDVKISGPFNGLLMDVDLRPVGESNLHLAISGDVNASKGELLKFVNPNEDIASDPYEDILKKYHNRNASTKSSELKLKLQVHANPELELFLDLGSSRFAAGMNGRGTGDIRVNLDGASKNYSILGDYTLSEGKFDVNANNIVHRQFDIRNGSSIKFGGELAESTVDLIADYETKASIATLIADTTSVSNRRIVKCGINIQNKISNPEIKFSIDIPDLDPSIQSSVESALSTEDKIQKQFLSLLLSNNFLPDEQNGIFNNSSLLYSNVSEIMANQINNIFNRLDIPLDLGLNYQPTETGANLFDVALSTQLWNNRIIIGGTLGNRQNKATNNNSIFGDLDIQLKVTRNGAFRVKAFSHAADQYSNFLDNSQRNGLGLSWQQDFDDFSSWIRKLFARKSVKEEMNRKEAEEAKVTRTIILDEK